MTPAEQLLSDIVFYRTYPKTLENGKKETWEQCVQRNYDMHFKRWPHLKDMLDRAYKSVYARKAVPAMRSLQFGGEPIERNNARMFGCGFTTITSSKDIADILYLSMCGTGMGYSVQDRHVSQLPKVPAGNPSEVFLIPDDKEGWADSIVKLFANPQIRFDYSIIRPEGALISSGGTASGPKALRDAHVAIRKILLWALDRRLTPLEVHDCVCHAAEAAVCGGVRRSALICLFDPWNEEMRECKSPANFEKNLQRRRANNSALVLRGDSHPWTDPGTLFDLAISQGSGEPGIYFTNDLETGTNPCGEIGDLRGFCNLEEVIASNCTSEEEYLEACWAAGFIGTLQAAYTDFKYIQPKFKYWAEKEALLGASMTGMAESWGLLTPELVQKGAAVAKEVNGEVAKMIGVNPAARVTTVKPSGTTSAVMGCSSGIHAVHAPFYVRRVTVGKSTPIGRALIARYGATPFTKGSFSPVEDSVYEPGNILVCAPMCKAKAGATFRKDESATELLDRALMIQKNWVEKGFRSGKNHHNVSLTVSHTEEDLPKIRNWLKDHYGELSGISYAPDGVYNQMPFEEITEEQYNKLQDLWGIPPSIADLDWSETIDERAGEAACAGGQCDVK